MNWLSLLGLGGSFLGGMVGNRSGTNQTQTSTTTPTLDASYSPLQSLIMQQTLERLKGGLPAGYEGGGIRDINRTYDLAGQTLAQSLAARGLTTSPTAGAADALFQRGRAGDVATFRAGLPLVQYGLQGQNIGSAMDLLNLGRGTTTTSTGGGSTSGGGGFGSGLTNMSQLLGYLIGSGKLGSAQAGGVPGLPIYHP